MSSLLLPFELVLLMFSGWVNRHQLDVIEYLQEENRVLKGRLGARRLRFNAERRQSSLCSTLMFSNGSTATLRVDSPSTVTDVWETLDGATADRR